MDAIAEAAGTTKPTFYARFGSKRGTYERAVRRDADALLATCSRPTARSPTRRWRSSSTRRCAVEFFAAEPDAFVLLFSSERAAGTVVGD